MEPEVVAAFIAVPASLFAAWAAYGAGKVQGRSAVDSVRRASQRESYARLLAACWAFTHEANKLIPVLDEHTHSFPPPPPLTGTPLEAVQQLESLSNRITECAAVVRLDGPPHIADLTNSLRVYAMSVVLGLDLLARPPQVGPVQLNVHPNDDMTRFEVGVTDFADEASAHLNAGLPSRRLRRWLRRVVS